MGAGCAHPQKLIDAMVARSKELQNVEIVSLLAMGEAEYTKPEYEKSFRFNAFFVGKYTRAVVNEGRADFTPIFLSEIPKTFTDGRLPIDVAMVQVSPPDIHGFCSFGISVDIMKTATANAKIVLAELNE